ncbi:MAG: DNA polymerase Y family protein [Leucobacter sp.]
MPAERVIVLSLPEWEESPDTPSNNDPGAARDFSPVFAKLTNLVPQLEILRPGRVVMRARGPVRYYGGEMQAASALLEFAHNEGLQNSQVGIADGRFTAEQAATLPSEMLREEFREHPFQAGVRIVEPGRSATFLSTLSVSYGTNDKLATLLPGLGIYTLGAFAALPEDAVRARFGPAGVLAHRHARGEDAERGAEIRPQRPALDFKTGLDFESPLTGSEQLAFACIALAEQLSAALAEEHLVCTTLRVALTDDAGVRYEREWAHPRFFTPSDMIARIRWQAESLVSRMEAHAGSGVTAVWMVPIRTDHAVSHEPGLWTSGPDERVHHHLSRAQSLLGPSGVGTATLNGGRLLRDRQRFTPWGVAPRSTRALGPWPGTLSESLPSLVFSPPLRARLLSAGQASIGIDTDDLLSADPHSLLVEQHDVLDHVRGWSKPWPIRERWWEGKPERFRMQIELSNGDAWILLGQLQGTETRWFAEGHYD